MQAHPGLNRASRGPWDPKNKAAPERSIRRGHALQVHGYQQFPPPSTRKKASMSASVPTSPSALKSAEFAHGASGHVPDRHAKNASMSPSVPTSPSQLKSAVPHATASTEPKYPPARSYPSPLIDAVSGCPIVPESSKAASVLVSPPQSIVFQDRSY